MTVFTRTWSSAYENLPAGSEDRRFGDDRMREIKADVRERLEVDHSLEGDADDGKHKKVTLLPQTATPTLETDDTALWADTDDKLYFKRSDGTDVSVVLDSEIQTLTDAANIAWDLDESAVMEVTLSANRTLSNPTNGYNGGVYILVVHQDSTGSRTLSYGDEFDFGDIGEPNLSTTASEFDILSFIRLGNKMRFASIVQGYS